MKHLVYISLFFVAINLCYGQQQTESVKLVDQKTIHEDMITIDSDSLIKNPNHNIVQKVSGSGNDICSEAIGLTVGTTFTCGSTSSNAAGSSFPNACVTTSGMGIQQFRTDWYCFNSGTNKTLAIVINSVSNATSFNPALAVFGPYASCTGGCAASMSGPLCDNGLVFQTDSIKILENLSQNAYYMIAVVERRSNPDINGGESISYCISVQPTDMDDCEGTSSGTCPTTCGNLCIFTQASSPTVGEVTSTCTEKYFSHRIQGSSATSPEDSVEFCYNFRVDTGCTVSFGQIVTVSGCSGPGNLTSANWKIYNTSTCLVTTTGTSIPPSATISSTGDYIFCMKYSAACLLHFGTIYFGYGTCVVVSPIVTPIELSDFSLIKRENDNLLLWTTLSEQNNQYFDIERGSDGIHFEKIGVQNSLAENGNSNYELNYTFDDEYPLPGLNYYRLKQTDYDGRYSYSKIIVAKPGPNSFRFLGNMFSIIQENPTIFFEDSEESKIRISVSDCTGKLIYEDNFHSQNGLNTYSIPYKGLEKGIYIIRLMKNSKQFISSKFTKI